MWAPGKVDLCGLRMTMRDLNNKQGWRDRGSMHLEELLHSRAHALADSDCRLAGAPPLPLEQMQRVLRDALKLLLIHAQQDLPGSATTPSLMPCHALQSSAGVRSEQHTTLSCNYA